ncbi:MAG: cyclic nucleotide-binding domain-containing protein [Acidimicrobiia bacterium]
MATGVGIHERIELLRLVWLFSECTDEELARIASIARPRPAEPGTELIKQGETGDEFFVVLEGEARATIDDAVVEDLGPGSFFGEMALMDGGERAATVTTVSPAHLLVLGRAEFNEMLEATLPSVAPKLLSVVGARVRVRDEHEGRPPFGY